MTVRDRLIREIMSTGFSEGEAAGVLGMYVAEKSGREVLGHFDDPETEHSDAYYEAVLLALEPASIQYANWHAKSS